MAGDENLMAENIKKGVKLFGITGTYEQSLSAYGIDYGTVTTTGFQGDEEITVEHNLNQAPQRAVLIPIYTSSSGIVMSYTSKDIWSYTVAEKTGVEVFDGEVICSEGDTTSLLLQDKIVFRQRNSRARFFDGTYMWIAIAERSKENDNIK